MLAPQNPIAPPKASAPALGWRTKAMAVRMPWAKVAGAVAIRLAISAEPPGGVPLDAALEVIGQRGR